ncbi:hypothetical protein ACFXCZ_27040 [Streptomyces sp. NPDC059396]|uniref:hypothetical protein n=1 Tax=Streptomyces sp. NPDC059396 TaxID=3346819 RepID=UPI0036A7BFB2
MTPAPGAGGHAAARALAGALRRQATQVGATTPGVRGGDWQTAVVTDVPSGGTVSVGPIVARCLDSYPSPAVGDLIFLAQSSSGGWVAVGRTTNADTGIGGSMFRLKTADDPVPNSTTLTDDTHLVVPVAAGAVYTIDGQLFTLGADFTSDLRLGYTYPAGAACHFSGPGPHTGITSGGGGDAEFVARQSPDGIAAYIPYGTSTSRLGVPLKGVLITGPTAGTFRVQWARNATGSGTVTVRAASWLKLTREA